MRPSAVAMLAAAMAAVLLISTGCSPGVATPSSSAATGGTGDVVSGAASGGLPPTGSGGSSESGAAVPGAGSEGAATGDALKRYALTDPGSANDLAPLAYLLERQSRLVVRGTAIALLNLGQVQSNPPNDLLLDQMRAELAGVATDAYADRLVAAMRQAMQGDEGEFTFPDRETIRALRLDTSTAQSATVSETLEQHFPGQVWNGGPFSSTVQVHIEMTHTALGWRLSDVQTHVEDGSQ